MRRVLFAASFALLSMTGFVGCGGHDGGVVVEPGEENPYQITPEEQAAMDAAKAKGKDKAEKKKADQ